MKVFYVLFAAFMVGAGANLVFFFGAAFLFAEVEGGAWVRWYFEAGSGGLFFLVTTVLAVPVFPLLRKLSIVSQ